LRLSKSSRSSLDYEPDSPFRVVIISPRDYADYEPTLAKYDLEGVKVRIEKSLRRRRVTITRRTACDGSFSKEIPNLFQVGDPGNADIHVLIVVDVFEYGDKRMFMDKLSRHSLWRSRNR